jgi:serine/threonine protein kinase
MALASDDLLSIRKQINTYSFRLRRTQTRVRDLQAELCAVSPRKRSASALVPDTPSISENDSPNETAPKQVDRLIACYRDLFDRYRLKCPESKPLRSRAVKPASVCLPAEEQTLPPISVRKLGVPENVKMSSRKRQAGQACAFLAKVFGSTSPEALQLHFVELRARNGNLAAQKKLLENEMRTGTKNRERLQQLIGQKKPLARILAETEFVAAQYAGFVSEGRREIEKFAEEKKRLKGIIQRFSVSVDGIPLHEQVSRVRDKIEEFRKVRPAPLLKTPQAIVPVLPLAQLGKRESTFCPATRGTRRAFSELQSARGDGNRGSDATDSELDQFGKFLGGLLVERFAPVFHPFASPLALGHVTQEIPAVDVPDSVSLTALIARYTENQNHLMLLSFEADEIRRVNHDFLKFVGFRQSALEKVKGSLTIDSLIALLPDSLGVAFWILRDVVHFVISPSEIPTLWEKVKSVLSEQLEQISAISDIAKTVPFVGVAAFIASILENGPDQAHGNSVNDLISPSFHALADIWSASVRSPITRSGFLNLFLIGKHIPDLLQLSVTLCNRLNSVFLDYLRSNFQFPSCVRAAVTYFHRGLIVMDNQDLMWHLASVFHLFVSRVMASPILVDSLVPLVSAMTVIVANRTPSIVEQLLNFHFLEHLITQFELEAFLGDKPPPPESPRDQPTRVSYMDIPKLTLPLHLDNPKLQLHFLPQPIGPLRTSASITERQYFSQRQNYPVYATPELHVHMIQLFFATVIDHSLHRLDTAFCDPFPQVTRRPNCLFTLMQHMEAAFNQNIIAEVTAIFDPPDHHFSRHASFLSLAPVVDDGEGACSTSRARISQFQDYHRLLRLTVPAKFHPETYTNGSHIASGAFGAVMAVTVGSQPLAVKVLEKSRNEFDNPHLIEVFTEVSILEICKGDRRVTQLHDYGCTSDSYYIVMEFYPTTLRKWRKAEQNPPIEVMLRIYREVLSCVTVLTDRKINHFDIKCDNVMLDTTGAPALGDFGESMSYTNQKDGMTLQNRGTEWIKSPEMLSIALNSSANPNYDRRKQAGAGPASDVWSIGCLFYELLTGEFLFLDSDWSRFFLRITDSSKPLLTEESLEQLPRDERFEQFLAFVLQRNVRRRPTLGQVIARFDEMFPDARNGALPTVRAPILDDHSPRSMESELP